MNKAFFSSSLLLAALLCAGCEQSLQAPSDFSLQARGALEVLPAGAQVVGMVNLEAARQNRTYEALVKQGLTPEQATSEGAARFRDFLTFTGFDPAQDLEEVYLAVVEEHGRATASLVVYADFEAERFEEYLDRGNEPFVRTTHAGTPVYCSTEGERERLCVALINREMIAAASSGPALEAMLDRLNGRGRALKSDEEMMRLMNRVAHPGGAWFVAREVTSPEEGPAQSGAPDVNAFHEIGRMMQNLVVSFGFDREGVELTAVGTTHENADADDVADLIKGALATMKGSYKADQEALGMLDRVNVREHRGAVEINLYLDEPTLRTLRKGPPME